MGWLSGWDKRIKLTIDQTKIDTANQLNFPALVYISAASGIGDVDVSCIFDELTSNVNRKKIAITTSDGTTECYAEIERWDDANEKAWLWVKIPSIAHAVDTDIYLYYDKDHAENAAHVGDTTDAVTHNVWDNNFMSVWHMGQDPSGGSGCIKDSTVNANDATPGGSMTSGDLVTGLMGKALDFDGSDDYLAIPDNSDFKPDNTTLEVICKTTAGCLDWGRLFDRYHAGDAKGYAFSIADTGHGRFYCTSAVGGAGVNTTGVVEGDAAWHHIVGTREASSLKIYDDGAMDVEDVTFAGIMNHTATHEPRIGNGVAEPQYTGQVCEFRFSDIVRTAPWIKATYHSCFDSLITFGSEETVVSNLLDGKIRIKSEATDLLDGKAVIDIFATDLLDSKIRIKSAATDSLDGKIIIKSSATALLDGKALIANIATIFFDGKALVTHTGQIDDYCPTPICAMSAVFRYARLQASPPVPEASFTIGKIIAGNSPVPDFTCIAYHGRNPSLIANAQCPTCSMRVGLSLSDIATISRKVGVPIPTCVMSADTHHLATVYGNTPCPLFTCDGDTVNITVISATVPSPTGLFGTTIGNVCTILGRTPCPSCTMVALTGQVISLTGSVPVPGSLVRFYASLKNETITLTGTAPTPGMISRVHGLTSSILRHIRGEVR